MYSLIRKSAVLLSILTLLPLASASAELKRVPLILMDTGQFDFPDPAIPTANLTGTAPQPIWGKSRVLGYLRAWVRVPQDASRVRFREKLLLLPLIPN